MNLAFPKPGVVRLKGPALEKLRQDCYRRDRGRCTRCGRKVSYYRDEFRPMHMAHWRNKRMFGDVLDNVTTRCADCHLIKMHNPKSVPPKGTR